MKVKVVISKEGSREYPYMASAYLPGGIVKCRSGKTPEEAEEGLIEMLKEAQSFQVIEKEIEI